MLKRNREEISGEWDHDDRVGKWSKEEEEYAELLIVNFLAGTLNDCSDGETLRIYLAKSLDCKPMRISKKLHGRDIGKTEFKKQSFQAGLDEVLALHRHRFIVADAEKLRKRKKRRNALKCRQLKKMFENGQVQEDTSHSSTTDEDSHSEEGMCEFSVEDVTFTALMDKTDKSLVGLLDLEEELDTSF